ncbi:macrolide 2'-phosphotransferase [Pseudactinotalea sp. Z1739]|uniref:macrolide 2'-phosphotransferase n=1 Tax=Pseudactinotalea sp. Z1739 TaxID=3413028 RepID=UPI003C7B57B2
MFTAPSPTNDQQHTCSRRSATDLDTAFTRRRVNMAPDEQPGVLQLTAGYGIEIRPESLERNSSGLDLEVFFAQDAVGDQWVLRVPRRDDVLPRAMAEQRALSFIREFVSFETPHWRVREADLIAYKSLGGTPAGRFTAEVQDYVWGNSGTGVPEPFTASLAEVLAQLHQLPGHRAARAGLPLTEAEGLRASMDERMHRVRAAFGVEETLWSRWQTWIAREEMWPRETGLIHGDLHPGHLLVDSEAVVTGVLDWTEAKVADISNDFVYHYMAFGEEELASLVARYDESGGRTWPLMTEHVIELAAAFPIQIAEFALATQTEEMESMARGLLGTSPSG